MALEAFFGLSLGYNFALSLKKEAEVKQGKNEYQASAYQIQNVFSVSALASRIIAEIPYSPLRTGMTVGNILMPVAGIVLCPASAMIKQGHYENGVRCFDALVEPYCPQAKGVLPEQINERKVKIFSFFAENVTTMTSVGLLAGTVALPFLGFGPLAAGILLPVAFEAMSSANLVPTSITAAVEKYMPTVSNASMLVGGGIFSQAFAAAALASGIPGVSDYVQKKIEKIVFKSLTLEGPSLEEIDAPWEEQNHLSFEEIDYILNNHDPDLYEINPTHCSKQAYISVDVPENRDFKIFNSLFETINWVERYCVIKPAFRDDDRFLDEMAKKFRIKKEDVQKDFEIYLDKLAVEADCNQEEFLARQLQEQMNSLVMILCGEKAAKGFQHDLQDGMDACSKILAYLLDKPSDSHTAHIEFEDILIKLAIEGGDYCARGIKRTAMEIVSGIIIQGLYALKDPQKDYELKIRQHLQLSRQQIMQSVYQKMIEVMVRLAKEGDGVWVSQRAQTTDVHAVAIAQDVHTMDLYRQYLSLGFCPLTTNERNQFGVSDFATWSMYRPIRKEMYLTYQLTLDGGIREEGELYFCNYFRQKISELPLLTMDQQETLIEKLTDCIEGEKTLKSFHRLFFVMQGILKVKPIYHDWVEVPVPVDDDPPASDGETKDELSEWLAI
jgi:hypothetical protein